MRRFHDQAAVLGLLIATATGVAHADPLTVANHSFEQPATPPDSFIVGPPPTGWSAYGSVNLSDRVVGVVNPATTILYVEPVPDGSNIGVTFLQNFSGNEAGLEQTLGATLELFTQYTLTVEIGNMASAPPPNDFDFDGFPGYRVELLAGGIVIASDNNTLLPGEGRFETSTVQLAVGAAHANAGEALGIRLVNLDAAPGTEVNFDDVRLDAVPLDCPASPPVGCKSATTERGSLSLASNPSATDRNAAAWTWKGEATTLVEIGDPTDATAYVLCVYDGADEVVLRLRVPAGGTCDGKDCWTALTSGYRYRDKAGSAGGITGLQFKAGDDGKALIKLKARGSALDVPALPLAQTPQPVRAVMRNEGTGVCWEAAYSAVLGDPASTTRWKARND